MERSTLVKKVASCLMKTLVAQENDSVYEERVCDGLYVETLVKSSFLKDVLDNIRPYVGDFILMTPNPKIASVIGSVVTNHKITAYIKVFATNTSGITSTTSTYVEIRKYVIKEWLGVSKIFHHIVLMYNRQAYGNIGLEDVLPTDLVVKLSKLRAAEISDLWNIFMDSHDLRATHIGNVTTAVTTADGVMSFRIYFNFCDAKYYYYAQLNHNPDGDTVVMWQRDDGLGATSPSSSQTPAPEVASPSSSVTSSETIRDHLVKKVTEAITHSIKFGKDSGISRLFVSNGNVTAETTKFSFMVDVMKGLTTEWELSQDSGSVVFSIFNHKVHMFVSFSYVDTNDLTKNHTRIAIRRYNLAEWLGVRNIFRRIANMIDKGVFGISENIEHYFVLLPDERATKLLNLTDEQVGDLWDILVVGNGSQTPRPRPTHSPQTVSQTPRATHIRRACIVGNGRISLIVHFSDKLYACLMYDDAIKSGTVVVNTCVTSTEVTHVVPPQDWCCEILSAGSVDDIKKIVVRRTIEIHTTQSHHEQNDSTDTSSAKERGALLSIVEIISNTSVTDKLDAIKMFMVGHVLTV